MSGKPTALDELLERVAIGDSQLHTKAVIDPLVVAARRELQVLREYVRCHEASDQFWNDASPDHQKVLRKAVLESRANYRKWRAEQEQQT